MRVFAPRPIFLLLTLLLVVGAIALIQLKFGATEPDAAQSPSNPPSTEETTTNPEPTTAKTVPESATEETEPPKKSEEPEPTISDAERIAGKEKKYDRAKEIVSPTGFINTDGVSIGGSAGKDVVLLQFWTYSCFNCQNAQPHINTLYDKYSGDGLQVIGVHKPEFEFEKDYDSVAEAARQENIRYPVVLDNNDATWDAYNQRFWPTWYLIDSDGFIRYEHFGEGGYEETDAKIQELLKERDKNYS